MYLSPSGSWRTFGRSALWFVVGTLEREGRHGLCLPMEGMPTTPPHPILGTPHRNSKLAKEQLPQLTWRLTFCRYWCPRYIASSAEPDGFSGSTPTLSCSRTFLRSKLYCYVALLVNSWETQKDYSIQWCVRVGVDVCFLGKGFGLFLCFILGDLKVQWSLDFMHCA